MSTSVPTGTVTFLFTDIEGSTKLAQEQRQRWEALRQRHHQILRSAIQANQGYIFQIIGDAFCAAFHTAGEALQAAVTAQSLLQAEDWGDTRIKARMGLNTGAARAGQVSKGDAEYTGYTTLARTQRVMSAAHGEQILLSNTTSDLVLGELPEGVSLRDMKEHRLKGLLNPEHLRQVVAPGLRTDFPALLTLNSIPNNLPIQLTSFIGREKEIAEIQKLAENHRLVTLTGSGGVGKTRHALQVAAEVLDAFPDGVWLVDLAAVSNPDLVLHAVTSALRLREDPGRELMPVLQDHLESKRLLLMLDNCEHLLGACAQAADALLRTCPQVKILASSREALGVEGEISFRVSSLALPDPQHLPALDSLTQYDSVRLFIERAVAAKPDFVISKENAPAVAQVCARLDGIPLAIELAAARVKGLAIEQISQRLDDRFRLLTGGSRTALPRHQTLRAMIEWSHDLLSEPERLLFRRLAVFTGDWTLEAAEEVCPDAADVPAAAAVDSGHVMDLLLRLVDRSLVVAEQHGSQTRYRMLETIGQFAREKLSESGEEEALRGRHLEWCLDFSEKSEPRLREAQVLAWLDQLGADYENLRSALEWSQARPGQQPPVRLARASEHLGDVEVLLGRRTRAVPLYLRALELLQRVEGADRILQATLHSKIVQAVSELKFFIDAAKFDVLAEIADTSIAHLTPVLQAAEGEPPRIELVRMLNAVAIHIGWLRLPPQVELAEAYARRAIEMAEQLDAPAELSAALGTLDALYFRRQMWRERAGVARRRLEVCRDPRQSDTRELARALVEVGQALTDVGEFDEALSRVLEGQALAGELRAVDVEKWALTERLNVLFQLDRWDEILDVDQRLRELKQSHALEHIGPTCFSLAIVASVHALRGDRELAGREAEESRSIMASISGPPERWNRLQHY